MGVELNKKIKPLVRMNNEQVSDITKFLKYYGENNNNAASSSLTDPNANVVVKSIGTMEEESLKGIKIQVNRKLMYDSITTHFDEELAKEYIRQLEEHEIYAHDESSYKPYCVSVSMYPFLLNGTIPLGGNAVAPKHLSSFTGEYINLVYEIASYFAGAVATVEFFTYFDHFARKDYGEHYLETHNDVVHDAFAQVVYSINEPAVARGNQSVFLNWSLFDEKYFNSLFGSFYFPDGDKANYETTNKLQWEFVHWFTEENKKRVLPFPVLTCAALYKDGEFQDVDFFDNMALSMSKGGRFFIYQSDSVDALSSCCRLRNSIGEKPDFSYTLGAGGISTGSSNVISLNVNRLIQNRTSLKDQIVKMQKYNIAHRKIMENFYKQGLLKPYDEGYISLKDQYLTIGLVGVLEGWEFVNSLRPVSDTVASQSEWMSNLFNSIYALNREMAKETGYKFNTEIVPAESLGVKFANWDKESGYEARRSCYNSYFYPVEENISIFDKIRLHGGDVANCLDGGSALHINLEHLPSKEGAANLINICASEGVPYYCTNVKMTGCNDCGAIHIDTESVCPVCGSTNLKYATRIIGYCRWIPDYSEARKEEANDRHYHSHC